jgi:hypothetical protein
MYGPFHNFLYITQLQRTHARELWMAIIILCLSDLSTYAPQRRE